MGLDPSRFWHLTPREASTIMKGASKRLIREQNQTAWLAWHIAALERAKKLPKLETLLIKPKRKEDAPSAKDAAMVRGYFMALAMQAEKRSDPA